VNDDDHLVSPWVKAMSDEATNYPAGVGPNRFPQVDRSPNANEDTNTVVLSVTP
jgi:hypothetical protein